MAVIILLLSFSSTYVFQAGLISVLVSKFQMTIYISTIYLALSIVYHFWSLRLNWERELVHLWNPGLTAVFVLQRTCAVLYYYFYKRTALMLGDPRYYQDSPWLRQQLDKKHRR
uniref:Transmembrane protein 138 n=1 Tax=Plectus sambesii TaxID=2011161 RepID=A0A914UGG2_9BILA